MNADTLFCLLTTNGITQFIADAKRSIVYAGPGIQIEPAQAMVKKSECLGVEMLTVCLDFDERVMRMGYGHIEAVKVLREAGISVTHAPGLRSALIIVDDEGYSFTPTPLYLEAEPDSKNSRNALRLSPSQVKEALARLSPVAKTIAVAQATDPEDKKRISELPNDVGSVQVSDQQYQQVDQNLRVAPPVQFDLARQVRVFNAYLQYVEMKLTGAAIQRHRLAIPPSIVKLGGSKDLEGRLRTTFDLIEKGGKLSSKKLEDELNEIRKNFTPSLGKDHGRVVLKSAKPHLEARLKKFRENLEAQKSVAEELQGQLDESRQQIIDYYLPQVIKEPPDAMLGQLLHEKPTEDDVRLWLDAELDRVFPNADALIQKMQLDVHYKDVTFETLNQKDFLKSLKAAFPRIDWEKPYNEFKAARESDNK